MLLTLIAKLCAVALSGPLAQGVRPAGLRGSKWAALLMDLRITAMCIVPTMNSALFVYWYREHRNERGDITIGVSISGTLLSFLSSFRSSQSYDRWFEGRSAFGRIHAGCRTLALYAQGGATKFAANGDHNAAQEFSNKTRLLLLGLIRSVILHLRGDESNESLREFLLPNPECTEEEALEVKEWRLLIETTACRPMILFMRLIANFSKALRQLQGGSDYRLVLTEYTDMVSAFNQADKICNTPSPNLFMYLLVFVYISFGWYLFPIFMSEVLHDNYWLAPLITFFVCYFFGLLVNIAIDMDHPFDNGMVDLPLEKYEAALRKDMDMLLGQDFGSDTLPPAAAEDGTPPEAPDPDNQL
eukprot:TRINITY_DN7747_c0_g1_i2.p2 TRINITY_DN7747_c0_g1~~TRINITY_DN7747_c0_g1_i2.p2  ORF type:complete len:358 (-),score=61.19 TRINITY_DN7747_c0_g1_i2:381-1454(-)